MEIKRYKIKGSESQDIKALRESVEALKNQIAATQEPKPSKLKAFWKWNQERSGLAMWRRHKNKKETQPKKDGMDTNTMIYKCVVVISIAVVAAIWLAH